MKIPAWIAALVIAGLIHGAIAVLLVPVMIQSALSSVATRNVPAQTVQQIIQVATIGWCVISSIWCAMVANILSKPDNRWHGIKGFRLVMIVAGLTLALDLINSPCLRVCPPLTLIVPILSYVAIVNNSLPLEKKDEPAKPG